MDLIDILITSDHYKYLTLILSALKLVDSVKSFTMKAIKLIYKSSN
jgi:hypothetical protein